MIKMALVTTIVAISMMSCSHGHHNHFRNKPSVAHANAGAACKATMEAVLMSPNLLACGDDGCRCDDADYMQDLIDDGAGSAYEDAMEAYP